VSSTLEIMTVGLGAGTNVTGIIRPKPPEPMPAEHEEHEPAHAHPGEH
jgi:hypothetical protein